LRKISGDGYLRPWAGCIADAQKTEISSVPPDFIGDGDFTGDGATYNGAKILCNIDWFYCLQS